MKDLKRWAIGVIQELCEDAFKPQEGMRMHDLENACYYKNAYLELCDYIWKYRMDYRSDDPVEDAITDFMHMAHEGVQKSNNVVSYKIFSSMLEVADDMLTVFKDAS